LSKIYCETCQPSQQGEIFSSGATATWSSRGFNYPITHITVRRKRGSLGPVYFPNTNSFLPQTILNRWSAAISGISRKWRIKWITRGQVVTKKAKGAHRQQKKWEKGILKM